jgi:hypothetical protein
LRVRAASIPRVQFSNRNRHIVAALISRLKKGGAVPLLKPQSKPPKTTPLQVRIDDDVRLTLHRYSEFLDANPSYVVGEALKLLFHKDDEFKQWNEQVNHKQIETAPASELVKEKLKES